MSDAHDASVPEPDRGGSANQAERIVMIGTADQCEQMRRTEGWDDGTWQPQLLDLDAFLANEAKPRQHWVDLQRAVVWATPDGDDRDFHALALLQEKLGPHAERARLMTFEVEATDEEERARRKQSRARFEALIAEDARRWARERKDTEEREALLNETAKTFAWQDLSEIWDEEPPTPEYLARTDGPAAFYAGLRNLVIGVTESGKSWLIAIAIAQEIGARRPVGYFDHENGGPTTVSRLRALGLTKSEVHTFLRYRHMEGAPLPPELAAQEAEKLYGDGGRVCFHDAMSPIAHSLGLDTSGGDTGAVEEIYRICLDPWARAGLAAVMLDNSPKGNKYDSLGSQHKRAGVSGAVLSVVIEEPFSARKAGSSKIYLNKDRGGNTETVMEEDRRLWGLLRLAPDPVLDKDGRRRVLAAVYPPPEPPDPMEALYEEVDRKAATLALARATLDKQGVTATESMKQLTEWMSVVQPLDPAFEHAHIDRAYVTDVLFHGTTPADRAEAGLHCTSTSYLDKARRRRNRYRVEMVPLPEPGTGE